MSVLLIEYFPRLKLQSNTQVIKTDKVRWHLPGFADDVCLLPFGGGETDRRTSSKVLSAVEYAKFKAWSTVLNRALFLGSPTLLEFWDDIQSVPTRLNSCMHKLFDFVVSAWIANLQQRGV